MSLETAGPAPVSEVTYPPKEKLSEKLSFNRYFREMFRRRTKTVDVRGLGYSVRMVNVQPQIATKNSETPVIVDPGWTEDENVLRTSMKSLVKYGHDATTFTPGKLLNPNRENYPHVIQDAIDKLGDLQYTGDQQQREEGKAVLVGLMKHKRFMYHIQKALELLAVIKTKPPGKVDMVAHSQGLIVTAIAALLEPDKFRGIVGIGGAGLVDRTKFSKLARRFGVHFAGSSIRTVTRPKDAWRITRGGIAAGKYFGKNRTQALREGAAIGLTDAYPALDYLDKYYGIKNRLIQSKKDRLMPAKSVLAAHYNYAEKTGRPFNLRVVKGGHNEYYVRADNVMVEVNSAFTDMAEEREGHSEQNSQIAA